jgi:hypothetical protein
MTDPQPSIYPFGIRIDEPMTTFTDVIVAAVCFYAFYQLDKRKFPGKSQMFFRYYFLLMGVATFLGGVIGHGFLYALSFGWKLPGWIISMVSVALIERSAISHAGSLIKPQLAKFFLIFNLIELVAIMTITMYTLDFKWVQFHSGYGLLAIVSTFHLYTYFRTGDKGSLYMLAGVGVTCIASYIYINKISAHTWFNYLDISHVLLAIAAYILYLGAYKFQERQS